MTTKEQEIVARVWRSVVKSPSMVPLLLPREWSQQIDAVAPGLEPAVKSRVLSAVVSGAVA
jgi:hypothetical protein